MVRDDAIAFIKTRLGKRKDSDLDAIILSEMVFVQENTLEGAITLPWFLVAEVAEIETRVNEERIPLPTTPEFLRELDEAASADAGSIFRYSEDPMEEGPWLPLKKGDYGLMVQQYPSPGTPQEYDLSGSYFRLKPTPDTKYLLRMLYYGRDVSLTTGNIENKWLKWCGDLLIAHTGFNIASTVIGDDARAQIFAVMVAAATKRCQTIFEAREHVGRSYHMGERP